MNKFHQIPTDSFVPISHENSYLFNHYDKIANFLAFKLGKNYKSILAKPVQNGYFFDWFSEYENLININEKSKDESELELVKYWEFIDIINAKIVKLLASNDENNINWANLLSKVFNHNDNFIFSNGKEICIVWGWKFDNTKNYKPNIIGKPKDDKASLENEEINHKEETSINPIIDDEEIHDKVEIKNDPIEEEIDEVVLQDTPEDVLYEESSFLKFLKWFASKFWWLLWFLLILIIILLLLKSCNCNDNDMNTKLNQLEQRANDCCN